MFELIASGGYDFKRTLMVGIVGGFIGLLVKFVHDNFAPKSKKSQEPA
jgi:hypothetical protein